MALWHKISCRPDLVNQLNEYYNQKFQAEIRSLFAPWIEERIMSDKLRLVNEAVFEQTAIHFCEDLQNKLATVTLDPMLKPHYTDLSKAISQIPPVEFYSHLRNGLQKELQFIDALTKGTYMNELEQQGDESYKITTRIQELIKNVHYIGGEVTKFQMDCEQFQINCNEINRQESLMNVQNAQHLNNLQDAIRGRYGQLLANRMSLSAAFKKIVIEYDELQNCVIDNQLKNWQRGQALAGNGAKFNDNLDEIQRWIELLVEIVCKIRNLINLTITISTSCLGDNTELTELLMHVKLAQERLILSAFIVEKQPPQVMKTNTRFAATVRWLIGPQLGICMANPTVECIILSESQAQRHCAQRQMSDASPHSSGEILNNIANMEYQQQTRHLSANFRNMQLKKIKRAEKKGTESVMDEKFALLFYTTSVVESYKIRAWTLSLPVVVIVHGNQEPQSWATITWDNAFSEINREPFQVPDRVSWAQLSNALNTKFTSATGRPLSEENLQFLYEKIFRGDTMSDQRDYVTWGQFCKEPLPDRTFTFWDWFFAIMKLTKDHLGKPWQGGRIVGFINKKKTTDEILKKCPEGTFLLRFSDSELGGITIAWVNECSTVLMLQPWTAKDLNVRGLPDRIQDLQCLRYLYPNIDKDEAFGEYYTPATENQTGPDGYVKNHIRAHVPGITVPYQSTPQHQMQSPNPVRDMQPITTSSLTSSMYLEIDALFQDNTIDFDIPWN